MPRRQIVLTFVLLGLMALAARADGSTVLDTGDVDAVKKALADKEPRVRLAAAHAAAGLQDKKLTAPLLKLLKDDVTEIRVAAAGALRGREDVKARKAAARGMAQLLRGLDREPSQDQLEREALLVPVLHDLAQPISIKTLLDIHTDAPNEPIKERLFAVANVPAPEAIEALINYSARRRGGDGHRNLAHLALRYATGQRFGRDPDTWRAWWREAKDGFDFEGQAQRRAEERSRAQQKEEQKAERKRRQRDKPKKKGKKKKEDQDASV